MEALPVAHFDHTVSWHKSTKALALLVSSGTYIALQVSMPFTGSQHRLHLNSQYALHWVPSQCALEFSMSLSGCQCSANSESMEETAYQEELKKMTG